MQIPLSAQHSKILERLSQQGGYASLEDALDTVLVLLADEVPNNTQMLTRTTWPGLSKLASTLARVSRPQNRVTSWMQMMYRLDCTKGSKPPKPPLNEKSTDYAFRQPGFR